MDRWENHIKKLRVTYENLGDLVEMCRKDNNDIEKRC